MIKWPDWIWRVGKIVFQATLKGGGGGGGGEAATAETERRGLSEQNQKNTHHRQCQQLWQPNLREKSPVEVPVDDDSMVVSTFSENACWLLRRWFSVDTEVKIWQWRTARPPDSSTTSTALQPRAASEGVKQNCQEGSSSEQTQNGSKVEKCISNISEDL